MSARPIRVPATGVRTLWPWALALAGAWLIQAFVAPEIDAYYYSIFLLAGVNVVLAVSLNLVNGFTGQFSMGHAGFMAVGAYTSAYLTLAAKGLSPEWIQNPALAGVLFLGALLAGGGVAAAFGFLVGLPSLRLRGDYLAIVTLGFGEIIRVLILNIDAIGGARGLPSIPGFSNLGWVGSSVVLVLFAITRLVNSHHGRSFLAVREDEIAAEAMGVHTTRAKVKAFVLGAFFAGLAGGLFGHYLRYLNPQTFDFNRSFEVIIMVVLGGMGSVSGSVVAAVFLTGVREALRPLQEITQLDFRMIIYSLLLILLMLTRPNGLFGSREIKDVLLDLRARLGQARKSNSTRFQKESERVSH